MYQYKINKLIFKDSKPIDLNQLTIIVGPNNSGKSRILKDILSLTTENNPTSKILSEVDITLPKTIEEFFDKYPIKEIHEDKNYYLRTLNANLIGGHNFGLGINDLQAFTKGWFRPDEPNFKRSFSHYFGIFLLTFLNTEDRLKLILESSNGDVNINVSNLLQAVYKEGLALEKEISELIKEVFKIDIKLDFSVGVKLLFRIGKDLSTIPPDPREARPIFEKLEKLDDQGDGIKSFLATFIALKVGKKPVLLLDEPEAFLHPPQAMKLGEIVADLSNKNQQIIIATHSVDFLRGIINKRQDITLIRVDRDGNSSLINQLDSKNVQKISNDPLLNSVRILDGLFYKAAVISEADADSVFYQRISRQRRNTDDIHYTHAHNKQTVYKAAHPYKTLGIKYAIIVDFDILNEKDEFKSILLELNLTSEKQNELLKTQESIKKEIESISPKEQLNKLLEEVEATLQDFKSKASTGEHFDKILLESRKRFQDNIEKNKPWHSFKKQGYKLLSSANQDLFLKLAQTCKEHGLFIVPYGELESWLTDYGLSHTNKKSKWITSALDLLSKITVDKNKIPWDFIDDVHNYLLGIPVSISEAIEKKDIFSDKPFNAGHIETENAEAGL